MFKKFNKVTFFKLIVLIVAATFLLAFPDIVFLVKNHSYLYLFLAFVIVPLILCVPVIFFYRRLRIYFFILASLSLFSPLAVLPVFLINSQMNFEMLGLALDSNFLEVKELVGWWVVVLVVICSAFFFMFLNVSNRLPQRLRFTEAALISGIAFLILFLFPFARRLSLKYDVRVLKNVTRLYYPYRIIFSIPALYRDRMHIRNYAHAVKDFRFDAIRLDNGKDRRIHVFVIGETARYDHWSVNGYKRQTSPHLQQMKNLVSYTNAATGGTITNLAIPLLITMAEPRSFEDHKSQRSILSAFKEAGYRSYWLSNQSKYGFSGSLGMHYFDGDSAMFSGWGANESHFTSSTDSALLPMIDYVLRKEKDADLFLIVHMMGSHWKYKMRYTPSFLKFRPVSDEVGMGLGFPSRELLVNEYDNSILFTDYVLSKIIERVNAERCSATVSFVSDHGENLGDDALAPKYIHSPVPNRVTAHVPLFFWASDRFLESDHLKFDLLVGNRHRPVSTASNLFYSLLDLAAVRVAKYDSTKSLVSPHFKDSEQEILGDQRRIYRFGNLK